ncbi:MAG: hypothetical protein WEC34_14260 [Acidimicrobiia bacterium]
MNRGISELAKMTRDRRAGEGDHVTVILACGGYRSGSTLQYNLLAEYAELAGLGSRLGFVNPHEAHAAVTSLRVSDRGVGVAKCHHVVAGYHDFRSRDEAWAELTQSAEVLPIYSLRDWRDVAASMCRKFRLSLSDLFESALWRENLANLDRWLELGAVVQRYEVLVNEPQLAISEVADAAGLPFTASIAIDAAVATRLDAVYRAMRSTTAEHWDERMLVHDDHIAAPAGGAWREWTTEECRTARSHLEPLLNRFGASWDA